jgi:hypothetical protein
MPQQIAQYPSRLSRSELQLTLHATDHVLLVKRLDELEKPVRIVHKLRDPSSRTDDRIDMPVSEAEDLLCPLIDGDQRAF